MIRDPQHLDPVDERLLDLVQRGIPITPRPFKHVGAVLGLAETEVIERLRRLRERGVIRRVGGVFDSKALGFTSALIGLSVPPGRADEAAEVINRYQGVTHNYLRDGSPNLWFTLICENRLMLQRTVSNICEEVQADGVLILPAEEVFKISTVLPLGCNRGEPQRA